MKNVMKVLSVLLAVLFLLAAFAGCGEKKAEPKSGGSVKSTQPVATDASETQSQQTEATELLPENYLDVTGVDFSNPTIVIRADDSDGMFDLAKKLQNYEIPEGTIVEITGYVGPSMMTHTICVPTEDGTGSYGTTYEVVGEVEYPSDGTMIHIIGVVRIGEYYPLLVVPAELYEPMG